MMNLVVGRNVFVVSNRMLSSVNQSVAKKSPESETPQQHFDTFYHKDLEIIRATPSQRHPKPKNSELKFGHHFSDHMTEINWSAKNGWEKPVISPLHNLSIHPGAKVLHYAIELFEGMKAYRCIDNKIRLFRPEMNMDRMRRAARRAALPPTLGVGHSNEAKLFVLSGPAGQYYATGFKPVSLLADADYIRASKGGVGAYKMGCNYAPTIMIGRAAADLDCQQVLWLSGAEENITEVGTMNIFMLWINENGEKELITPPLEDGLILPGVTRDSLLTISRDWNEFKVSERNFTMSDLRRAIKEKRVLEMFGAGTACVVSPVGRILYKNSKKGAYEELLIPTMENKPNLMQRLYETIIDIQYGKLDYRNWMRAVD